MCGALLLTSQGQNLAVTVSIVPYSHDNGTQYTGTRNTKHEEAPPPAPVLLLDELEARKVRS